MLQENLEIVLFLLHPHYYTSLTPLKRESTHNLNLLPKCLDDNIDFYRRLIQMRNKNEPKNEDDLKF